MELCCSLENAFRFKGLLYLHETPVKTSSISGIMHRKTTQCVLIHVLITVTYRISFALWFCISYAEVLSMHLSVQLWLNFSSETLKKLSEAIHCRTTYELQNRRTIMQNTSDLYYSNIFLGFQKNIIPKILF